MINLHSPFPPGRDQMRFGDVGEAAAAALYVTSNIFSWSEAKQMPKRQAEANKKVLDLQKAHYDNIVNVQRMKATAALNIYRNQIQNMLNNEFISGLGSNVFQNAFPDVPKAAEYVPVDPCCEQGNTIECNITRTQRADNYVRYVNRLHERNDLIHALATDPRFMVTLDIQSKSIQDLTRGILPVGDVVEVMTDVAEQAALTGRIGNTKRTTARDLGISKLRAQAAGRREFREATQWANTVVSPIERQASITSMMLTPQQRIELALHQSQLIQQSLQNKNNALAQKAPFRMAKLQMHIQKIITELQSRMNAAMLTNNYVPNYAATVVPKLDNVSGLVGAIGQGIAAAQTSHFFGGPPGAQNGYTGSFSTPWSATKEDQDYYGSK